MGWWGKVVGGTFGFMLGGPLGAIFGAAVGHQFDRGLERIAIGYDAGPGTAGAEQERIQAAFFTATFAVMGYVAKADGRVSDDEIEHARAVMREMRLEPAQVQVAQALFRQGRDPDFDLDAVIDQLVRECRRRQTLLQMFLEIQLHAALADGELHAHEDAVLRRLAGRLGFSPARYAQLLVLVRAAREHVAGGGRSRARRGPPQLDAAGARAILGISRGASAQDIKKAYRRLMNQHHPDKLIAKGMPEEMIKLATSKTQEIRRAYELLRDQA